MHDDVSTYFALVYRRREPVLVMKRVKRKAMFRPSWKFAGKPNSIPAPFFVLCFRVFLGGLRFRGLRFLGGLPFRGLLFLGGLRFRGLRFLGGLRFRGLRFLGGLPFRGLRFLGGLRFRGLRFLGGLRFRGLRFLGGLPFQGLRFLGGLRFRGLRFLGGLRFRGLRFLGGLPFRGLHFLGGLPFRGLRFLGGLPFRGLWSSVFGLRSSFSRHPCRECVSGPRHQSKINIEMFEVQFWIYIQTINKIFLSVRKTIYSTFSIPKISTIGAHRKPYKNSKNNKVICGAINE